MGLTPVVECHADKRSIGVPSGLESYPHRLQHKNLLKLVRKEKQPRTWAYLAGVCHNEKIFVHDQPKSGWAGDPRAPVSRLKALMRFWDSHPRLRRGLSCLAPEGAEILYCKEGKIEI